MSDAQKTILDAIRAHFAALGPGVTTHEVKELAPGMIMVLDTRDKYFIFFDRAQFKSLEPDAYRDEGRAQVGLIADLYALNWSLVITVYRDIMSRKDDQSITWHKEPVTLDL